FGLVSATSAAVSAGAFFVAAFFAAFGFVVSAFTGSAGVDAGAAATSTFDAAASEVEAGIVSPGIADGPAFSGAASWAEVDVEGVGDGMVRDAASRSDLISRVACSSGFRC